MKYIKKYSLFLEAEEILGDDIKTVENDKELSNKSKSVIDGSINDSKVLIDEFKENKSKMENIFKDVKINTDSDIDKELLIKVYKNNRNVESRNKWLKELEIVLKSERRKDNIEKSIRSDSEQVKNINFSINDLNREVSSASSKRKEQIISTIEENKKRISTLNDNINNNRKILSKDLASINKRKDDFIKMVAIEEDRLKKLSSK